MSVSENQQPSTSCPEVKKTESGEPYVKRHLYVEEVRAMWNLAKVIRNLGTREQAVKFAEDRGLIQKSKMCHYHKKPMHVYYSTNKTVGSFVCNKNPCKFKSTVSRSKGTWFENVKIEMPQIFYLIYAYASKWSYDMTIKEDFSEREQCLSRATINDWFSLFREAVVIYLIDNQTYIGKIGGPGKTVQINESKIGKRNHNNGRHIEGHWVLSMIEDDSAGANDGDLRLEICRDNMRSADVLIPLIKKHIAEGTIIHTDMLSDCNGLENYSFIDKKVNRSDPDYSDLLFEHLWRREIKKNRQDPFESLLDVMYHAYKQ